MGIFLSRITDDIIDAQGRVHELKTPSSNCGRTISILLHSTRERA